MHRWLRTLCWTLAGAAIGATAKSMWLTIALSSAAVTVGLVTLAGPIAKSMQFVSRRSRAMLVIGIGVIGGVILATGATFALRAYEAERKAEEQRKEENDDLRWKVAATNTELVAARARNETVDLRRRLQVEKIRTAMHRISEAIETGGSLRYRLEHERGTNPEKFSDDFRSIHVAGVEKWRAATAAMLDQELPGLGLGTSFSAVEGRRIGDPYVYELSRLLAAIDNLRGVHRDVYRYVEQLVP